jgi:hypothetical protein
MENNNVITIKNVNKWYNVTLDMFWRYNFNPKDHMKF